MRISGKFTSWGNATENRRGQQRVGSPTGQENNKNYSYIHLYNTKLTLLNLIMTIWCLCLFILTQCQTWACLDALKTDILGRIEEEKKELTFPLKHPTMESFVFFRPIR